MTRPGICELCRQPLFRVVSVKGWDGSLGCDCEHRIHYVCAGCVTEWNLDVSLGRGTLATCLDNVRTARAVAGDDPPFRGFSNPCGEVPLGAVDLAKWRARVTDPGPPGQVEIVVGDGDAPGAPHLAGLTPAEQDNLEKQIRNSLAEQIRRDVDRAWLGQAAADAEVRRAAREARLREMGDL